MEVMDIVEAQQIKVLIQKYVLGKWPVVDNMDNVETQKKRFKVRIGVGEGPVAASSRQLPLNVSCGCYDACGSSKNKSSEMKVCIGKMASCGYYG